MSWLMPGIWQDDESGETLYSTGSANGNQLLSADDYSAWRDVELDRRNTSGNMAGYSSHGGGDYDDGWSDAPRRTQSNSHHGGGAGDDGWSDAPRSTHRSQSSSSQTTAVTTQPDPTLTGDDYWLGLRDQKGTNHNAYSEDEWQHIRAAELRQKAATLPDGPTKNYILGMADQHEAAAGSFLNKTDGYAPNTSMYSQEEIDAINSGATPTSPDYNRPFGGTLYNDQYIGMDGRMHWIHPEAHQAIRDYSVNDPQGYLDTALNIDRPERLPNYHGGYNAPDDPVAFHKANSGDFRVTGDMLAAGYIPRYTGDYNSSEVQNGRYTYSPIIDKAPWPPEGSSDDSSTGGITQDMVAQLMLNQGADPNDPGVLSLLGLTSTGSTTAVDSNGNNYTFSDGSWHRATSGGSQGHSGYHGGNSGGYSGGGSGGGSRGGSGYGGGYSGGDLPPSIQPPPGWGGSGAGYGLDAILSNVTNALRDISVNVMSPRERADREAALRSKWERGTSRAVQQTINALANRGVINSTVAGTVLSDVVGKRQDAYADLIDYLAKLSESSRVADMTALLGAGNLAADLGTWIPGYLTKMYALDQLAPWQAGKAMEDYYKAYSENELPSGWSV